MHPGPSAAAQMKTCLAATQTGVSNTWRLDTEVTTNTIDTFLVFNNPSFYSFSSHGGIVGYLALTIANDTMSLFSITPDGMTEFKFLPSP
jgi:hypothetical protein